MGQSLAAIAQSLKDNDKKVQLIYAFNGTGKTRLSREFKELIAPKRTDAEEQEDIGYKVKHCAKKRLEKLDDGTFTLFDQNSDSPFSYHLFLLSELERVILSGNIQKYHFNFLRNLLEKTSTFLGYNKWRDLLPEDSREAYFNRIINLSGHGKFSSEEVSIIEDNDKRVLRFLVEAIKTTYHFKSNNTTPITEANVAV